MKTILRLLLVLLFISCTSYSQIKYGQKYNAYSGTMVFTVDGGMTLGQTDYARIKPDYMGRLSLEYFLPANTISSFGIRGFAGGGYIAGKDNSLVPNDFRTKMSFAGGGIIYCISLSDLAFPFLFAGASYMWFDPFGDNGEKLKNNIAGKYKKSEINYTGELGVRIMITSNFSFNLSGGVQLGQSDFLDDIAVGTNNDFFYFTNAGFSFSFFSDEDSDGDGIPDSKDACPGTPKGVKVDENGCPLDSDNDGVPDYLDKCPNTAKGIKVDSTGCPLDSDGDGVPDYKDICPDTPHGIKVDNMGCPIDSDRDGVPDYKDKCPGTPINVQVDENGCPIDSDHDGVPDYLDKCPGTAPGKKVDSTGCPETVKVEEPRTPAIKQYTLGASTGFASGKSVLLPTAYPELDKLVSVMNEYPMTKWSIEGYTDNTGSDVINMKLSFERAESVLNYFVSKGIDKRRFNVAGYGKASPVASNATPSGRAMNRRVEIKQSY